MRRHIPKEEHAIVLDYLPHGDPLKGIKQPIVYALGYKYFILLALVPKPGVDIKPFEKVYIGDGLRPKIKSILRRVRYEDLSALAKDNLMKAIEQIIQEREDEFVKFFNEAGPLNVRVHTLELLPGIGKTILREILDEREKEPFKSLEDIKKRIRGISDPKKILAERILREILGEERIRLFVPA